MILNRLRSMSVIEMCRLCQFHQISFNPLTKTKNPRSFSDLGFFILCGE